MKYETPEVTALASAISAVQSDTLGSKVNQSVPDGIKDPDHGSAGYQDWE